MRVGFTIALNAVHHFRNNDYAKKLAEMLDYWVVIEGAAGSSGSTEWCKEMPDEFHFQGGSIDGTAPYIQELAEKFPNVILGQYVGMWDNKDRMVNRALRFLRSIIEEEHGGDYKDVYLWQIDADEQWTSFDMGAAESYLLEYNCDVGEFYCNYFIGEHLQAVGEWGEGKKVPYRRLWRWKGQDFESHEPPQLKDDKSTRLLCPQRFDHYAYYFPQDVKFKDAWYSGHEGIYDRWVDLNKRDESEFPCGIDQLITGPWGRTDTQIIYFGG
jgi:hypothetical protein